MAADSIDDEPTSGVEVALTMIPSGIQCVKITVLVGSQTVNPPLITVTPGASSASLNVGQLPAGNGTFTGSAFNVACSAVTSSTVANWVADPATAVLVSGVVTQVALTFRRNNPVTVSANFLDNVAELAVGVSASYARMADGTVKEWGNAGDGQFSLVPIPVPGLTSAVQIAAGDLFACARRTDGSVACWGAAGPFGVLGPGAPLGSVSATPVTVPLPDKATDLAAGKEHVCVIIGGISPMCWGRNLEGQLGNGTTMSSQTPVGVVTAGARVFAGQQHSCLITSGGHHACGGGGQLGTIGDGAGGLRMVPTVVPGLTNALAIRGHLGSHSCVELADRTARCWGVNDAGQIGDGTRLSAPRPTAVKLQ